MNLGNCKPMHPHGRTNAPLPGQSPKGPSNKANVASQRAERRDDAIYARALTL